MVAVLLDLSRGASRCRARARFRREYIAGILEQHHGRLSDAGRALGVQRTNLCRKLRALRAARSRSSSQVRRVIAPVHLI